MNRSAIDDQNNDNIVDEPQDILEEDVEDDDANNNEFVHISCPLWKKPNFLAFMKKANIFFIFFFSILAFFKLKAKYLTLSKNIGLFLHFCEYSSIVCITALFGGGHNY